MKKRTRLIAWFLALALILQILPTQTVAAARDTSRTEDYGQESVHVETEMVPVEPVTEPTAEPAPQSPPETLAVPEEPLDPADGAEDFAWTLEEGVLTITGNGDMPQWNTSSDVPWDSGRAGITTIVIGEGVTSIEYGAFSDCSSLTQIKLPEGLESIGDHGFDGCAALTAVELPVSLEKIGVSFRCSGLKELTIPGSVRSIDSHAFYDTPLTRVVIEEGCTVAGGFESCDQIECTSLKYVDLEGMTNLTTIGRAAFYNCDQLTSIRLPETVENIWSYAFYDCDRLSSIHLGSGLKIVYQSTFYSCNSLKHITLPDTVTAINERAFGGCTKLESIIIPEGVTTFHWASFENVPKTMTVYAYPETEAWNFALNKGFNVASLLDGKGVITLTVLDGNGEILTDGYRVNWYERGSDEIIATGTNLIGVDTEQVEYDYEILLGEELVYTHRQPLRTGAGGLEIIHTLEPIGTAVVSGITNVWTPPTSAPPPTATGPRW